MVLRRSSSTPTKPATPMIDEPISKYRQPLRPGPLSSPTILPFEIGSTITDSNNGLEYQLVQPLGNGSYAVVYMVHEKSTNQFYALKCLSKADLNDFHLEVQRNEVFLHEKLSHPNIVRLEHYFETSEWLFLVLEYCEGQDLYFWLTQNNDNVDPKTGRYLSENERMNLVKHVFIQILEAVGYCHSKGIAHRDLKPENFIVMIANNNNRNKDNGLGCSCVVSGCSNDDIDDYNDNNNLCRFADIQIKLTDFGLATEDDESIDFDCGSKPYMSYECRNPINETYNPRLADIWSLGIIFLNLIYHRSPWNDPNPDRCKSFASFQLDKIGFLMQKFPKIPKKIAYFLANYVFNNSPEKGRIEIDQWKIWCDDLDEKLNTVIDEDESHRLPSDSDSSKDNSKEEEDEVDKYNVNYDGDDDSWSDILGEFVKELNIDENDDDFNDDKIEIINNNNIGNDDVNAPQHLEFVTTADDDDDSNAAANNSDADSGFGTDEDTNSDIIKRLQIINNHRHMQQQQEEENSPKIATNCDNIVASNVDDTINSDDKVTITTLSTTPPRIIICKPKPWDEPSPRTPRGINDGDGHHHHHHHDDTPSRSPPTTFNDHWSSSNQRRERVEKRRKEKQGQLFSSWGANRRRGSLTNNNNNNNNESTPPSPWDSSFNNNRHNQVEPPVTPTRRQYHHFNNKPYNNHYNNNESLSANNKSRNITNKRSAPSISPHHHAPRKTKSSQSIKNSYRSSSPTKTTVYYHPYQSKGTTGSTTPKKIDKNNDDNNNNNNNSNGPSKVTFSTVTTAATSKTGSLTISSRVDDDDDNEKIRPRSPPSSPKYYFDKTPKKKVAKSTKINLSKMLTGVVMFNRSVKVGGREHNDF